MENERSEYFPVAVVSIVPVPVIQTPERCAEPRSSWKNRPVEHGSSPEGLCYSPRLPVIELEAPLKLFNIQKNNETLPTELCSPKFSSFPSCASIENDASLLKVSGSMATKWKRLMENFSSLDALKNNAAEQFDAREFFSQTFGVQSRDVNFVASNGNVTFDAAEQIFSAA